MSDYRVKVSISNARIRRAVEQAGFSSVRQMCKAKHLSYTQVWDLVTMKISPLNKKGEWRKSVLALADALYLLPDDLFSEQQKVVVLKTSTSTKDIAEAELVRLSEQYFWENRIEDMQENEGVRQIDEEQEEYLLKQIMDAALLPREKQILYMNFGIQGSRKSFREIGEAFGMTRERISQLQIIALKKLRSHAARKTKVGRMLRELNH